VSSPVSIQPQSLALRALHATHATQAIAFESKPGLSTRVVNVRLLMTFVDAAADPPSFAIVGMNGTWAKVAWEPSRSGVPGSVFYVQYRPRGQCSS